MPKYRSSREQKSKCHKETKCITEETQGTGKRKEEARRGEGEKGKWPNMALQQAIVDYLKTLCVANRKFSISIAGNQIRTRCFPNTSQARFFLSFNHSSCFSLSVLLFHFLFHSFLIPISLIFFLSFYFLSSY